ncbi:hypothetical protein [Bradyrhizobium sp. USDA 3240]
MADVASMASASKPAATCLIAVIERLLLDSTGSDRVAGLLKRFR